MWDKIDEENLTPELLARSLFPEPICFCCDFDGTFIEGTREMWENVMAELVSKMKEHKYKGINTMRLVLQSKNITTAVKKVSPQARIQLQASTPETWPKTHPSEAVFLKGHRQHDMPRKPGLVKWNRAMAMYCGEKDCCHMDQEMANSDPIAAANNCRNSMVLQGQWNTGMREKEGGKKELSSSMVVTRVYLHNHTTRAGEEKESFKENLLLPLVGIGNLEIIRKTYGPFVDYLNEHHKIASKPPPGVRITNYFEKEGEGDKYQFDRRWQEPIPTNRPEFKDLISQHDHMNCLRSILVCVSNELQCADEFMFDHRMLEGGVLPTWPAGLEDVRPVHLSFSDPILLYGGCQLHKGKLLKKGEKHKPVKQPFHYDFVDVTLEEIMDNLPARLKEHPHTVKVQSQLGDDKGPWSVKNNPFLKGLTGSSSVSIPLDKQGRKMGFLLDDEVKEIHIKHGDGLWWGGNMIHCGHTYPHGEVPPWHPSLFFFIDSAYHPRLSKNFSLCQTSVAAHQHEHLPFLDQDKLLGTMEKLKDNTLNAFDKAFANTRGANTKANTKEGVRQIAETVIEGLEKHRVDPIATASAKTLKIVEDTITRSRGPLKIQNTEKARDLIAGLQELVDRVGAEPPPPPVGNVLTRARSSSNADEEEAPPKKKSKKKKK